MPNAEKKQQKKKAYLLGFLLKLLSNSLSTTAIQRLLFLSRKKNKKTWFENKLEVVFFLHLPKKRFPRSKLFVFLLNKNIVTFGARTRLQVIWRTCTFFSFSFVFGLFLAEVFLKKKLRSCKKKWPKQKFLTHENLLQF